MAKSKGAPGVVNRLTYVRANYLYQAAGYLASQAQKQLEADHTSPGATSASGTAQEQAANQVVKEQDALRNTSRKLLSDMREVTLKVLIRQTPEVKRTICRFCNSLLVHGDSSTSEIVNHSKDGAKPWADMLVITCNTCGRCRRYPVNALRQKKKGIREKEKAEKLAELARGKEALRSDVQA